VPVDPRDTILSAAIFSRTAALELCSFLRCEDFTEGQRPVYLAIKDILSKGDILEPGRIAEMLQKTGVIDSYQYLYHYLDDHDPQTNNLIVDSPGRKIVMEHIRNQRVRQDVSRMLEERRYEDIPGYVSSLNSPNEKKAEGLITDDKIDGFLKTIREHRGKKTLGYSTGLHSLDEITGGMIKGQVWAVGAPTSAGKTTLLCQFVAEAMRAGAACLFFSLEMSLPLMYARLAGAFLGINPTRIYRGQISDQQETQVQGALEVFRDFGLRVYREISDVEEITRCAREAKIGKGRVDVVAVDFMQNLQARGDNMLQQMAEGAKALQGLSGNLDCCVLVASQLSNEGVRDKGGGIFSYRYASELAHAADTGIEIIPSSSGPIDLHIRKNRHGATGKIQVRFNEHYSAFTEVQDRVPTATELWGNN
jgi:replicative DNA helicase